MKVGEYCNGNLTALFSIERDESLKKTREICNDAEFSASPFGVYVAEVRAVVIQLMNVAIVKNAGFDVSADGHVAVLTFLARTGNNKLEEAVTAYNRAFAEHGTDGIAGINAEFFKRVCDDRARFDTKHEHYAQFCTIYRGFTDDFKSVKLVPDF